MIKTSTVVEMKPKAIRRRKYSGADHVSFNVEQLKAFFDTTERYWGKRETALFLIGFANGLRVSELAGLRVSDINLKNRTILIWRNKGGRQSHHQLSIYGRYHQTAVLSAYLKERAQSAHAGDDALFLSQKGGPLDRSQIFRLFVAICQKAGIDERFQHPHCMRHTYGFRGIEGGMTLQEVQQGLGHQNISSTAIYCSPTQAMVDKSSAKAFRKLF